METLVNFFKKTWQFFAGVVAMIVAGILWNRRKDYSETFEKQDKEITDHKIKDAINESKIEELKKEMEKEPEVDVSGMTDDEVVDYWKKKLGL